MTDIPEDINPYIEIHGDNHINNSNIIGKTYGVKVFHLDDYSVVHATKNVENAFCMDEEQCQKTIDELNAAGCNLVITDIEF